MESGVAPMPVDIQQYREDLERRPGTAHGVMRAMIHKARALPSASFSPKARRASFYAPRKS
jgi:hypothetical protein